YRHVHLLERVDGVGRDDENERIGAERLHRLDDPVDEPPAEQRMQVLGRGGFHPRAKARGHHDGCEVAQSWGARIRTWDRGTKTRCLTSWLRPIAWKGKPYRGSDSAALRTAAGASSRAGLDGRRRKRRLSTWPRPIAWKGKPYRGSDSAALPTAAGASSRSGLDGRRRKRRLSSWPRPMDCWDLRC